MTRSRSISIGIALVLIAGCAGFVGASAKGGDSGGGSSASAEPGAWINGVKERGELRVACADSPPTSVVSADNKCDGPVLLPFKELAKALDVKFVGVGTTYQAIIAGLQANKYDIAANIDATMERTLAVQFTVPGWTYEGVFLLSRSESSKYPTSDSILTADEPIATAQGTSFDQALAATTLKQKPLLLKNYQEAAEGVKASRASSLFTDIGSAVTYAQADDSLCIVVPNPVLVTNSVVNGVSTRIDAFSLQTVNFAIEDAVNQGRFDGAMKKAGYISAQDLKTLRCD